MEIQQTVGRNVRRFRLAAGLSQWQLVERLEAMDAELGVDQAYVSHLENGRKNPTVAMLWHLAQALEVSVSQLVDETVARKK